MSKAKLLAIGLGAMALSACGSDPDQAPVEQIVIRAPGETAPASAGPEQSGEEVDLVAAGQAAFAVCTGCHVAQAGEPSMAGPNLHGVVGRAAGALDDYAYSDALLASGLTWTQDELDAFLANPTAKVAGTTMVAGAVSDPESRAAIIAYLGSLSE